MSLLVRDYFFYFILGLAYSIGVLSIQHYSPSSHDFYINTISYGLVSIGCSIYFIGQKKVYVYINNIFWIFLLILFFLQPIVNNIIYVDGLIFPIAEIFLVFILSIAISNLSNKENFLYKFSYFFIIVAFFLLMTQFLHVFKLNYFVEILRIPLQNQRYSGNLFQPNQTAFVFVLGVVSIMLVFKDRFIFYKALLIFFLSVGVIFTASRSGLLLLLISVFIYNLIINYFNEVKLYKIYDFYFVVFSIISAIYLYKKNTLSQSVFDRSVDSLEDPRVSLLYQSWLNFLDHPLAGIGWKNFASSNFQYYEKLDWVSLTDHSHFIFGQFIAEFGVLGVLVLLFFFYIFFINIFKIKDILNAYAYIVLFVFLFYSCFEYPLWYFKYLFVFSIFFAFIDKGECYSLNKSNVLSSICFILFVLSGYYIYEYRKYAYANDVIFDNSQSERNKIDTFISLPSVFGFTYFSDLFLYEAVGADTSFIDEKIVVGERLVNYVPDYKYLLKQATFLALDSKEEKSLQYFNLSCKYDNGNKCQNTLNYLNRLSRENPHYFKAIYEKVSIRYHNDI